MKLRTAVAVAALSLATVPMVTPADAFGIVIRFGGFHRVGGHHVARHHRSSGTRVARNRSRSNLTPPKPVQTVSIGPQTLKTPDGDITVQGIKNKEPIGPVVVRRPGASKDTAAQIVPLYNSLPESFRDLSGGVTFYLSGTIGEMRQYTKLYGLSDQVAGKATISKELDPKGRCLVSLVEDHHADLNDLKFTMAHELTHCIDIRLGTTTNTDFLESFFADVNKKTRAKIVADGFEHYIEPEEALAEAVAYYIVPNSSRQKVVAKWDADFPTVNAQVYQMLTAIKVNVAARGQQPSSPPPSSNADYLMCPIGHDFDFGEGKCRS
jgi:hypothetical protein